MTQRSGLTNNAMTWNDEGDRIRSDRAADSTRGSRLADRFGEPAVGCERAGLNLEQRTPNAQLKLGTSNERA